MALLSGSHADADILSLSDLVQYARVIAFERGSSDRLYVATVPMNRAYKPISGVATLGQYPRRKSPSFTLDDMMHHIIMIPAKRPHTSFVSCG